MREIKFRLWDKENKKMYHHRDGWYDAWYLEDEYDTLSFPMSIDGFVSYKNPKNAILLQYTGLKDLNGAEIYEGDILVIPIGIRTEKFLHVIKWEKETATFILEEVEEGNMTWYFDDLPYETGEVIGNIYENPELLEGNK